MIWNEEVRSAFVVAPHFDDEILGPGGTVARLTANGADVRVAVVTQGPFVERSKREAAVAHELLGISEMRVLPFPAAELDTVAHREVNDALLDLIQEWRPEVVFAPFPGDVHMDHQLVFLSSLVASRPASGAAPTWILAYETVSETNWNAPYLTSAFHPNFFVDISDHLERKLEAMKCYESKLHPFPHERSVEALDALAKFRGSTVGCRAAEAFVLVRAVS